MWQTRPRAAEENQGVHFVCFLEIEAGLPQADGRMSAAHAKSIRKRGAVGGGRRESPGHVRGTKSGRTCLPGAECAVATGVR